MPPRRNPSREVKKTATGSESSSPLCPKPPKKPNRKAKKTIIDTSTEDVPVPTTPDIPQGPFKTEIFIDSRLNPIDLTRKSPPTPHKNTATSPTTPRRSSLRKKTGQVIRRYWTTGPLVPTNPFHHSQTHPRRWSQCAASRSSPTTSSSSADSPPRLPTSPHYGTPSPPYKPLSPQCALPHSPPSVWPRRSLCLPEAFSFGPPATRAAAVSLSPTSPAYVSSTGARYGSPQDGAAGLAYGLTSREYSPTSPEYRLTSARGPTRKTSRGPMYSSEYPDRVEYSLIERKDPAVVVTTVSRDEPARSLEGGNGKRAGGGEGEGAGEEKRVKHEAQRWRRGYRKRKRLG